MWIAKAHLRVNVEGESVELNPGDSVPGVEEWEERIKFVHVKLGRIKWVDEKPKKKKKSKKTLLFEE